MSDYFATAHVRVKPDPKGFRDALRTDIKRAIANAGVFKVPVALEPLAFKKAIQAELRAAKFVAKVAPDTTGFREALLKKLETTVVPIKVVPILDKKALAAQVAGTTLSPGSGAAKEVEAQKAVTSADERGTRAANALAAAQLRVEETTLALAAAKRDLAGATLPDPAAREAAASRLIDLEQAKIRAEAQHAALAPRRVAGVAGAGSAEELAAQKAVTAEDQLSTKAANELAAAQLRVEETALSLAAAERALAAATSPLKTRMVGGARFAELEGAKIEAEAQHKAALAAAAAAQTAVPSPAGGKTSGGQAAENVTRQTAAERALSAVQDERSAAQKKLTFAEAMYAKAAKDGLDVDVRKETLGRARQATINAEDAATRDLTGSTAALTSAQQASLATVEKSAVILRAKVDADLADIAAQEKRIAAGIAATEATAAADAALAINIKEITTRAELQRVSNKLTSVAADLEVQEAAAIEAKDTVLAGDLALMRERIAAQEQLAVAQRDQIKSSAAGTASLSQARRGAVATLASFAGLRGAVLAASQPFLLATIGITALVKSLAEFASLERELNTFKAVTGATADEMLRVSAIAKRLGADITLPSVSASDAAVAMTELAKAGLSVNDAIAGTRGVLQLATAAQIDNAAAAELTASALNAFGLAGEQATHVADVFANAANAAQGSISDIGAAFQQASAVARQAGITFEDTTALLTIFAANGLRGSDAGTSLRTALLRLIAPTKNASFFIQKLGLDIRDAQGNIRPDIFAQFGEATANLPPALRDFIAETIAGQDAIRAFAIGARDGRRELELTRLELDQQGTAQQVAAARTKGLSGEFQALTSNLQTTATELGKFASGPAEGVLGVLDNLTTGVGDLLSALNKLTSGDFGGGFKDLGKDAISPIENAFTAGTDAGKRFRSLFEGDDPFKGFKEGPKILQDAASALSFGLVNSADESKKHVTDLADELTNLQSLRIKEFELRLPVEKTTRDIEVIRAKLKSLNVIAPETIPLTPIDKAIQSVKELVTELEEARGKKLKLDPQADTSSLDRSLALLRQRLGTRLTLQIHVETLESERNRLVQDIKDLREKAAGGDQAAQLRIELDQAQIDRINTQMKQLRHQIINTLQGIKTDAKKTLSGRDLADTFLTSFQAIALAPEQLGPALVGNLRTMIKQIGATAPLTGAEGKKIGDELLKSINDAMKAAAKAGDTNLEASLADLAQGLALLFKGKLRAAFKAIGPALTADDIANLILPQDLAVATAEAFGSIDQQVASHQAKLAKLNDALVNGVKNKKGVTQRVTGKDRVSLLNQIAAEEQTIASLTKQKTDDIQSSRDKADQAILDSFGTRETELQNALVAAQGTAGLADDIRLTRELRDLYAKEIAEARTRIKDVKQRNQTILALEGDYARANNDLANLEKDQFEKAFQGRTDTLNEALQNAQTTPSLLDDIRITRNLRLVYQKMIAEAKTRIKDAATRNAVIKDAQAKVRQLDRDLSDLRKQQNQRFRDSLQLDIDFASTKEDISGEIKARQALVRELQKEQKQVDRGTNEWKELRNAIATENKAIADLKKENDKKRDAMRALAFSFLQTQQGFAANLFGNLIPLGATGGLVGNQAPGAPLPPPTPTKTGTGLFPRSIDTRPGATKEGVAPQVELADSDLVTDLTSALKELSDAVSGVTSGVKANAALARAATNPPPFKLNSPTDPGSLQDPSKQRLFTLPGPTPGLLEKGNVDLLHRPHVRNKDGSISSVDSASFEFGFEELPASVQKGLKGVKNKLGRQFEVLLPQVLEGLGRVATREETLAHFRETGENLGIFTSAAFADAYADRLHKEQAALTKTAQKAGRGAASPVDVQASAVPVSFTFSGAGPLPSTTPRPDTALTQTAAASIAAGTASGMTAAQAATLIKLMTDLVAAVKAQNVGSSHPEAKHGRQAQSAAWETQHQ